MNYKITVSGSISKNAVILEEGVLTDYNRDAVCKFLLDQSYHLPPYFSSYRTKGDGIWIIATDPVGSIPIFYMEKDNTLFISNNTSDIVSGLESCMDEEAEREFLAAGYTMGEKTLISGLKQLQAGEFLIISKDKIQKGFYYRFLIKTIEKRTRGEYKTDLKLLLSGIFQELIRLAGSRHLVVSLSGGYDSRLIVYYLHKLGYANFSCITYGRTNNVETENARLVCEKLGIKWTFIDYTQLNIRDYISTALFREYYPYIANHSSMFFMQDYFAIHYLKTKGLIPEDSIFIPGHTGDVLAGGHLMPSFRKKLSKRQIASEIFRQHFLLTEVSWGKRRMLLKNIENELSENFPVHLIYEDWELRSRQAKFIVNSARIYTFFGYSYYLPLWDKRLMDFFRQVPLDLKLGKKLYDETLIELFEEMEINFAHELIPSSIEITLHEIKQKIVFILPILKRLKKLQTDDKLCYKEITSCMLDDMKKNRYLMKRYYTYSGIIVQWYLHQLKTMQKLN